MLKFTKKHVIINEISRINIKNMINIMYKVGNHESNRE